MMKYATAKLRYVRISPRKARYSADLVRNLTLSEAQLQLKSSPLKGARYLYKTLKSAIANAETKYDVSQEKLKIHRILVDEGPTMKRAKSKSRGGKVPVMKRTSHYTVILETE